MSDTSKTAEDEVDKAILDALHRRADSGVFSKDEDEALIATVVARYIESPGAQNSGRRVPWFAATGLLAAAAAMVLWWLPAGTPLRVRSAIWILRNRSRSRSTASHMRWI